MLCDDSFAQILLRGRLGSLFGFEWSEGWSQRPSGWLGLVVITPPRLCCCVATGASFGQAVSPQAERTNKQISLHPLEAKTKAQRVVSKHEGVADGYVPENPTPTLPVNLRADIVFRAKGLEESGSSFVGNDVRQPKQFPVNASTIGDPISEAVILN